MPTRPQWDPHLSSKSFNSMVHGICSRIFKYAIFKHIVVSNILNSFCEITLSYMPVGLKKSAFFSKPKVRFIKENAFVNVFCKIVVILLQPWCIRKWWTSISLPSSHLYMGLSLQRCYIYLFWCVLLVIWNGILEYVKILLRLYYVKCLEEPSFLLVDNLMEQVCTNVDN